MPAAPLATIATGGLFTTEEIARNLRRSTQTIRRWVVEGMPVHRVNRRLHFDPAEVDAWIRARNDENPANDHRTAIKRLVDAAPELTAEQAERIRAVLTGGAA
ncbi:helix-turn-helix domain-containing protein [Mycolicibacterium tokaiense]|uniref:Helix-turn-helix domain n=1 Tax=Mycolicibacterium tokaiense TaxID=39695 RepID=A0A378TMF3_9MYCO|nr:helix-turn-helix domain-containing protein [Mycolicibacterium tokaiense]BBY84688.1 hypothetical protein MTOK_04700 [Mycolicibacterium tokaiense]STZ60806.1 Helix-turn-helix domain [Mycolicibacterium tokaiense]